jgi:hypothetical protein
MAAKSPKKPSPILPQDFALPIKPNGQAGKAKGKVATACLTVRLTPANKRSLLKYLGKRPVSLWLREAISEKLGRELEERNAILGDAQALMGQEELEGLDLEG